MGRVSVPADVADRVGFLAGRGSDCVTGQTLIIDGGCSLIECRGLVMDMHSETIIVITLTVYPSPMPSSNICVFPPTSQRTTLPHTPKPQHDLPPHGPRNIRIRLLDPRLIPLIHNLRREICVDGRDHQLHIYKQSAHAPQERKRKKYGLCNAK